jgi:alkylation response protein AidB-like acyl-CoA dehydrogenase
MDYPVERFLRDVRVHGMLKRTNEIVRPIVDRKPLAEA